jgi:pilus assembly protein CpaB
MKPKTLILMVVAVACGLGASYMTSRLLAERNNKDRDEQTVPVLVATGRILAWQPIKEPERVFEVKYFPESVAPPKSLRDFTEIRDKRLNKPLDVGKPVTEADLLTKEQMSLAENLLPGQRAIAIKVTAESLVAGFVLPGTRVDVVCTQKGTDSQARIILQNMMVLAVDMQDQRDATTKAMMGQTVTLAASPEEATRLALAQSIGELRLLLKSGADTGRTSSLVTRPKDLDKAIGSDIEKESEGPRAPTNALPLPPVVEEQPKKTVVVEEKKVEPVKKHKRHVMTIRTGPNTEKAVFVIDDDEDENTTTTTPKTDKEDKPKEETKKPEAPKPATPTPPPSAFGKSMRTGRIR